MIENKRNYIYIAQASFKANNNGILTLLTSQMNGVNHRVVTYSSCLTLSSNGARCCHTKFAALTRPDLPYLLMMDPLHSSFTNIKYQKKTTCCCIVCYWMFSLGIFTVSTNPHPLIILGSSSQTDVSTWQRLLQIHRIRITTCQHLQCRIRRIRSTLHPRQVHQH